MYHAAPAALDKLSYLGTVRREDSVELGKSDRLQGKILRIRDAAMVAQRVVQILSSPVQTPTPNS